MIKLIDERRGIVRIRIIRIIRINGGMLRITGLGAAVRYRNQLCLNFMDWAIFIRVASPVASGDTRSGLGQIGRLRRDGRRRSGTGVSGETY